MRAKSIINGEDGQADRFEKSVRGSIGLPAVHVHDKNKTDRGASPTFAKMKTSVISGKRLSVQPQLNWRHNR